LILILYLVYYQIYTQVSQKLLIYTFQLFAVNFSIMYHIQQYVDLI